MQIAIRFDDEYLMHSAARNSPLVFVIYWEHGGIVYPDYNWTDFGVIVIGWWLMAARSLVNGAERETFYFMDGPQSIIAENHLPTHSVDLSPLGTNSVWKVSLSDLTNALLDAANLVSQELMRLAIGEAERADLAEGVRLLRSV